MRNLQNTFGYALSPGNHLVIFLAYQYTQLADVESSAATRIIENSSSIAHLTRQFNVPVMLTNTFSKKELILASIQAIYPDQKPVYCNYLDAWKEKRVTGYVRRTGKQKLVLAGLLTEDCLQMTALSAIKDGYEVYILTDASGGYGIESHKMSLEILRRSGAILLSGIEYGGSLNLYSSLIKLINVRESYLTLTNAPFGNQDTFKEWLPLNLLTHFPSPISN